jgi:hypothetical protein
MTHKLVGRCHCNQITLEYATAVAPEELKLRADQCSFCRRHRARTISDPAGSLRIVLTNSEAVSYYQFGLKTAEFLICQRCGVYAGAIQREEGRIFGVVNVNTFETPLTQEATPVDYDSESVDERRQRRRAVWTPTTLVENWGTFSQRGIR